MMQWVRMPASHQSAQRRRQQQPQQELQIIIYGKGGLGHVLCQSGKHKVAPFRGRTGRMGAAFDGLSLYHGGGGLQVLHSLCTDFTFHLHKV